MKTTLREHRGAVVIVTLFAVLGVIMSIVAPIFESSDEIWHYPVVAHIAATGTLPVQEPGVQTLWEQEGSQPPLYYLLSAGLTFWVENSDLAEIRWINPHAKLGIPLDPDNKNMIIHTEAETFPWQKTVLAVHLIRFMSIALSAMSVTLTYLLARELWPGKQWIALLSAGLIAFNPMFIFISASVNNDNLIVLLGTWVLLLVVRVLRQGVNTRRTVTLAIVLALATLTKISGVTFVPLVGLAYLIHAWRTGEWKQLIRAGLIIAVVWLLIAGWWYARNITLYGELFGTATHVAVAGGREITLWELRKEWYGFWVSYWVLLGGVGILADPVVYWFYGAISLAGFVGLLTWVVLRLRKQAWDELLLPGLLLLQIAVIFVSVVRWTMITYASQGRLLFPVIGAFSVLTAFAILRWLPERRRAWGLAAITLPMLIIAIVAPFRYVSPAYALPPIIENLPENAANLNVQFGPLELVGMETTGETVEAGGRIPVTLYWRATEALEIDYSIYLHALGQDSDEIGKIDTYPGGGKLPTSQMQPGEIIRDVYSIELEEDFLTPTAVRVLVGVWDIETGETFDPVTPSGDILTSVSMVAGVAYPAEMAGCDDIAPADDEPIAVGNFAQLWIPEMTETYQPGDVIEVPLVWDSTGLTSVDWTVFVHLVDDEGELAAQGDAPPLNGDYPTSLWQLPCQFTDKHMIELPPDIAAGEYTIFAGMYDSNDPAFARAPALDSNGEAFANYAIPVGVVYVNIN